VNTFPALDLTWPVSADAGALVELLHGHLDEFEPQAIHDHESADGWRVFFKTPALRDAARAALRASLGNRLVGVCAIDVPDEEWARRSQANLTAVRVGRIVVAPPWHDPTRDSMPLTFGFPTSASSRPASDPGLLSSDLLVVIDPSTGFGTGHHETTRLCLGLLQEINLAGRRVIDVGTGSGVLAIASAKLGAAAVVAFDEDPEALRNARENVERNAVAVTVEERTLASFRGEAAQVVVANLTVAVIEKQAEALAALVESGGHLIVSGFSVGESRDVARACGLKVEHEVAEGDWAAILLLGV
jgi:ribosomal protein L11 methyltransferase